MYPSAPSPTGAGILRLSLGRRYKTFSTPRLSAPLIGLKLSSPLLIGETESGNQESGHLESFEASLNATSNVGD